jgi:hypothetical protein
VLGSSKVLNFVQFVAQIGAHVDAIRAVGIIELNQPRTALVVSDGSVSDFAVQDMPAKIVV